MTTENQISDTFLRELLQQIIDAEGFNGKPKIIIKDGSEAGEGFNGIKSAIEIENGNKTLKLFAKSATKNEKERSQILTEEFFRTEIIFYDTIYPEFLKFQLERNVKQPFNNVPRCYLTSMENLNETLIFENLKDQGYDLYNKKIEMNEQHISLVLKLYARFHAVSYVMKDQNFELYTRLSENLEELFCIAFKRAGFDEALAHYSKEAEKLFDSADDSCISNRIKNLAGILLDCISNVKEFADEYSVITHGDCWFNNYMFKYKDSNDQNSLEDIKILDWQIIRVNSPVLDLSHFFYGIATKRAMAQLEFYLKTYHNVLSDRIKEMGSDPEKLYPYHVFRDHWKKFCRYGLAISFFTLKMVFSENAEVPNPSEAINSGKKISDAFVYKIEKEELYQQRIKEIIEHFVYNDFI